MNLLRADDEVDIYEVDFHRQYKLTGKSFKPDVEDKRYISRNNIVMCLRKPTTTASTKRVRSMLHFSVDINHYNCQCVPKCPVKVFNVNPKWPVERHLSLLLVCSDISHGFNLPLLEVQTTPPKGAH
ncbi:hypothetical protein AVEN_3903-1 [Araneus ventricosus]|uniref:Uncharacterized protein n=1 Tax=Araneus ventricosus TaxID=182803 RepID=A0A4Y2J7H3_ARAVE|nr:hypothetical protein AVEN_3903-1 [Araneus ventricosus]